MHPLESSVGQLYIGDGDGNYVPFAGIHEAKIAVEEKYNPDFIFRPEDYEVNLSLTMTHKSERTFRKAVHAFRNSLQRQERHVKRMKEKTRRAMLKGSAL